MLDALCYTYLTLHTHRSKKMEIGKTYVFFCPPSWMLSGTVTAIDGDTVVISDAAYLESNGSGHSSWELCTATKPAQMTAICARAWPLPDGTRLRIDAQLIVAPCVSSLATLNRANAAAALRGAK